MLTEWKNLKRSNKWHRICYWDQTVSPSSNRYKLYHSPRLKRISWADNSCSPDRAPMWQRSQLTKTLSSQRMSILYPLRCSHHSLFQIASTTKTRKMASMLPRFWRKIHLDNHREQLKLELAWDINNNNSNSNSNNSNSLNKTPILEEEFKAALATFKPLPTIQRECLIRSKTL